MLVQTGFKLSKFVNFRALTEKENSSYRFQHFVKLYKLTLIFTRLLKTLAGLSCLTQVFSGIPRAVTGGRGGLRKQPEQLFDVTASLFGIGPIYTCK